METDCKHVAQSDDEFTRRMRFHQSWYRHHVLDLPPGPNPSAGNELYGNLLMDGDGRKGWNFLSEGIHKVAEARLEKGVALNPAGCVTTCSAAKLMFSTKFRTQCLVDGFLPPAVDRRNGICGTATINLKRFPLSRLRRVAGP